MALGGLSIYPGIPAFPLTYRPVSYVRPMFYTEQMQREQEERRRKQQEANLRAEKLFLSRLTPEQLREFQHCKEFLVTGSRGTRYRINCTYCSANVIRVSDGTKFCAGPPDVPNHDFWLAQKLLIEANEDAFLKVARQYPQEGVRIGFNAFFGVLAAAPPVPTGGAGRKRNAHDI